MAEHFVCILAQVANNQEQHSSFAFSFSYFPVFFFEMCLGLGRDCNGHLLLGAVFGIRPCKTKA
jgi:hypothetical protein